MNTVDLVIKASNAFYGELQKDENARFRSWEHCYKSFYDARKDDNPDYDHLSLQLAFYLASWGMYRGSSFLLQKDYKVHIPVVKEIMKKDYDCLLGVVCADLKKAEVQGKLEKLNDTLSLYYDEVRKSVKDIEIKKGLSTTLLTKILLGALGCVPAYDRYFIEGVKDQKVTTGIYNIRSLLGLADFYEENYEQLERARKKLQVYDLEYPQMKLLDMGFWQIGYEKSLGEEKEDGRS